MADGLFDDLVPAGPAPAAGSPHPMFDDLVPQAQPGFAGGANAAATGFASGVPIVGPALNSALDKGVAGIEALRTGQPYGQLLAANQAQEGADVAAHPYVTRGAGVAGGVASMLPAVAAAPAVFGAEGGALTASQLARGAASGAAVGGADAAARGASIAGGAALGAVGGAAAPALGAVVGGTRQLDAPIADALRAAADAGYNQARGMGVVYHAAPIAQMADGVKTGLAQDGILRENAPTAYALLGHFENPPPGSFVPFGNLDAARKAFGRVAGNFTNPTDQLAAKRVQSAIDDFVVAADPKTVIAGPADQVGGAIRDARANWAAASRVDQLSGIGDAADLRAAAANSGQNIGNATRQRVASLLGRKGGTAGYTDDEIASLRGIVEGSPYQNATRYASNYLGGGGGLGGMLLAGAGAHFGGPFGAAAAAMIGPGLKKLSNASTTGALDQVVADTARRSPLFEQMMAAQGAPAAASVAPIAASGAQPLLAQLLQMQGSPQPSYPPLR